MFRDMLIGHFYLYDFNVVFYVISFIYFIFIIEINIFRMCIYMCMCIYIYVTMLCNYDVLNYVRGIHVYMTSG
jgi:hypothetical protein